MRRWSEIIIQQYTGYEEKEADYATLISNLLIR